MITPMISSPAKRALRRRGLAGVLRLLLALCIVLGWGSRSLASDVLREAPVDDPFPQTLVLVPLESPDRLSAALAAGLIPYGRYGGSGGEFLLAGVPPAGDRIAPDLGFPMTVLDADPSGATYYLAVVPPGSPEPDWAAYGRVLWQDIEQALLRTTPADAERLVEAGAEIAQITLAPVVVAPAEDALAQPAALLAITPDPQIQGMINAVNSTTVYNYDAQLSGVQPVTLSDGSYTITSRYTNSGTPIQKARQFVGEHMAGLGYTVENHAWSKSGYNNVNVVGQRTGTTNPDDIYIIGAHLDDMPSSGAAPGADDNASGSVATLIAADIMSQYEWGCTLRFAFWTGEEQGMLGSSVYAARSKTTGETVKGYLNLDMVAYNAVAPRELNLFWKSTVPASQNIADLFVDVVSAYGLDLVPFKYDASELHDRKSERQQVVLGPGLPVDPGDRGLLRGFHAVLSQEHGHVVDPGHGLLHDDGASGSGDVRPYDRLSDPGIHGRDSDGLFRDPRPRRKRDCPADRERIWQPRIQPAPGSDGRPPRPSSQLHAVEGARKH